VCGVPVEGLWRVGSSLVAAASAGKWQLGGFAGCSRELLALE
jgi:hypothetical protein